MDKNIGENISKNLSGKYSQKNFYHAKKSAIDAFKTASKIVIQKTAETTGDLIGNKIVDKTAKVSKYLQQNNSQTVKNENDKKIPKERYIFPEERQEVIDKLRSNQYNNGILKITKFSKDSQQNNSKTDENDKEMHTDIPKER